MALLETCNETAREILRALAVGLALPEEYFLPFHSEANNQLRLLHYPRYQYYRFWNGSHRAYSALLLAFLRVLYWQMRMLREFQPTPIFVP